MSNTSKIVIEFRSHKDFDVRINNIDCISPRGLELAFARVEREFRGKKGEKIRLEKESRDRTQEQSAASQAKEEASA